MNCEFLRTGLCLPPQGCTSCVWHRAEHTIGAYATSAEWTNWDCAGLTPRAGTSLRAVTGSWFALSPWCNREVHSNVCRTWAREHKWKFLYCRSKYLNSCIKLTDRLLNNGLGLHAYWDAHPCVALAIGNSATVTQAEASYNYLVPGPIVLEQCHHHVRNSGHPAGEATQRRTEVSSLTAPASHQPASVHLGPSISSWAPGNCSCMSDPRQKDDPPESTGVILRH